MKSFYLSFLGYGLERASNKMFNKNTWYSLHQWKTYSQKFNGNQYTGGKNAHGGAFSAYGLRTQYKAGEMNTGQYMLEQGSNLISTFGGTYGAAWGVGWEIGRAITNIPGYHENVRLPAQRFLGIRR
ncbi:hypothetical protein [Parapedobacter sp. DT-150]|uniref:hypothetical protein n=1 Tax=Parapedobacter sp. DT-150 TaxID=3396162 RepID=UPI003F1BC10C